MTYPGRDQVVGTSDDKVVKLDGFQRKITIRDIRTDLRSITVDITYKSGPSTRAHTLTTYMSNRS